MTEKEPVLPAVVEDAQTFLRDFMKPQPEDPSAFVAVQVYKCSDGGWRASFDIQCELELESMDRVGFDDLSKSWWANAASAMQHLEMALGNTGWTSSGHWRIRQVPHGQLPEPDLAVPVMPTAAAERREQALERISRVSPHLARMATEVQELMLWDQYANGALSALIRVYALELDESSIVAKACKYADTMMEARQARTRKKAADQNQETPQ